MKLPSIKKYTSFFRTQTPISNLTTGLAVTAYPQDRGSGFGDKLLFYDSGIGISVGDELSFNGEVYCIADKQNDVWFGEVLRHRSHAFRSFETASVSRLSIDYSTGTKVRTLSSIYPTVYVYKEKPVEKFDIDLLVMNQQLSVMVSKNYTVLNGDRITFYGSNFIILDVSRKYEGCYSLRLDKDTRQ